MRIWCSKFRMMAAGYQTIVRSVSDCMPCTNVRQN